MSTREEMIAHDRTVEEIAAEIGADSLAYLSLDGVYEAVGPRARSTATLASPASTRSRGGGDANGKFALEGLPVVQSALPPAGANSTSRRT